MSRDHMLSAISATAVAMELGLCLVGFSGSKAASEPIPGVASTYTTTESTIPSTDLDKCPVSRQNFDALRMSTPETFMLDVIPCGQGKVVQEYEVGYGRRSISMRVWKFPREGGGHLIITTTNYMVSSKAWE